jgi:hypothetical protein
VPILVSYGVEDTGSDNLREQHPCCMGDATLGKVYRR